MMLIDEGNRNKLAQISEASFPNEAAAAIVGKKEGENYRAEDVVEAEKILESPTAFEMRPEFVAEVIETAEGRGSDLIGFFHSHPGQTAHVSNRDKKFMKLWPGKIWIIAGVDDEGEITEIKAFKFTGEGIEEDETVTNNFTYL